ncbi:DUF2971 domain-containing protein [Microbulbifer variabilis]|uniref:DUF2971 domain-containing protein n=1 Tax=Microbulbifer variabilis TaxID=266805 RepID=A0ABY4VLK3_9GAMM|nr:DUF2971 domain-containing protein [Microbulbifer variabilis]USD23312.1 DUF2971 domain-containing protein [Microbulbifer variabilis]
MILYKYMSFQAAQAVVDSLSIGFSCLEDLNDPFECTSFGFANDDKSGTTASLATTACKNRFSRNYGILSLTRQPLNPLMWSHYGDEHQGVVVGIDIDKAGLSNIDTCIIPSQYGEVIYSATKPHSNLPIPSYDQLMNIGNAIEFDADSYNLLKRAFLYKSTEWSYEEEVRVVKQISHLPFGYYHSTGRYGEWSKISVSGRPLYCLDIPEGAIKEIYLGRHIYKNVSKKEALSLKGLKDVLQAWGAMDIQLFSCEPDINSWGLKAQRSIHQC